MAKVPPELLQKIKDAVNIVEVVGEHVVLRKTGANHVGLCPFHSERSPSFSVSENKQLYHCYGCKRGGDLLSFVMEIHGTSFPEAIEELADRAKIAMPRDWSSPADANEDPEVRKRREVAREKLALAHKLNRFVAAFYHQSLVQPGQSHIDRYFRNRGVDVELGRNFYVGGAPASWDALSRHLVAKKAPLPIAVELGLIRPSQKQMKDGPGYFDLFRNRAMFPILDMRGKVAGFGGRALPLPETAPDVGGESPKYMNSPESLIFQKGKLAYGLYQAQKHIREKDEVILVEGYFDVLALHAAGFQNVVATCGTALTPDHLAVFRRLGSKIVILFDGDKAGVSATERAMEIGLDHGLVLYGAAMPEGLDPDEVLFDQDTGKPLPQGVEQVRAILEGSKPLLDSRVDDVLGKATQGPEEQTQAVKKIAAWLARFKDPVGREVRLNAVQGRLGVSRQLLEQAMAAEGGERRVGGSGAPTIRPPGGPAITVRPAAGPGGGTPPQGQARPSAPPAGGVTPSIPPRALQARGRPSGAQAKPARLTQREQVVLSALAKGGKFSEMIAESRGNLPPQMSIPDLFDYPPARDFTLSLFQEPGVLERLREVPETILQGELDPQVRSILTEALVSSDAPFDEADLKLALSRCLARVWARFSQQIKAALADAEAKKDAGLHSQLMKDYLDVQRKMKEFSSFYDEA